MARKNNLSIIKEDIYVFESNLHLTDEKLKSSLGRVYEIARSDAQKAKWYKHYSIPFSAGATLFITLLTADFKSFLGLDGQKIRLIFILLLILSIVLGIVMLILYVCNKDRNLMEERDAAVNNILSRIISDWQKSSQ